jgi:translocation and assembly module TamB
MERQTVGRIIRWIGAVFGGLVILLLLATVGLLLILQTQYGRDRVTGLVAEGTRGTAYQVHIEGFTGAPPWRLEFERVALSDDQGVWIALEGVRVRWALTDALRRVYHLPFIRIEQAHWHRLPEGEPAPPPREAEEEPFAIPELPSVIIGEIRVDRLLIDEGVFGSAQVVAVEGELDTHGDPSVAMLTIHEHGREGDRIVIDIRHDADAELLSVDIHVNEDPGGIIGGLLGLSENGAIQGVVSGRGPSDRWQGVFNASIGGYGRTEGRIGVSLQPDVSIALDGKAVIEQKRIPPEAAALLGNEADFVLRLARIEETLRLENAAVRAGAVELAMDGVWAVPAQAFDIQINITFDQIPAAATRMLEERGIRLEEPGPVQGSIKGSLHRPEVEVDLTAERLVMEGIDLNQPRIALQGQLLREPEQESTGFTGTIRVGAESLMIPELPPLAPVQGRIALSTPDFDLFTIQDLSLSSPGLSVSGSGTLNREGWQTEGTIDVHITDPDMLLGIGEGALPGSMRLQARIKGDLAPPDLGMTIAGRATELANLPEAIRVLAGEELILSTELLISGPIVRADDFVLEGKALQLKGTGQADLDQERFSLSARGFFSDLAVLPGEFAGALTIAADAAGRFDDFTVSGTTHGTDVRIGGEPFVEPASNFTVSGLPSSLKGRLDLTAGFRDQGVGVSGRLATDDWRFLSLSAFEAQAPGVKLSAELRVDLQDQTLSGQVQAAAEHLAFIAAVTGLELTGQAAADLEFASVNGTQEAVFDLKAETFSFEAISASQLSISGHITDLYDNTQATAELALTEGELPAVRLTRLDLALSGRMDDLQFRGRATGLLEHPFDIAAAGGASITDAEQKLRLDLFEGEYAAIPINLAQPTTVTVGEDVLALTELLLTIGEGVIRAQGELAENVDIRVMLRDLPMEVISLFYPIPAQGSVDGDLLLSGSLPSPVLKADFSSRLSFTGDDTGRSPLESDVSGGIRIAQGKFSADVSATGFGPERLRAEVSFPAEMRLSPLTFDVPPDGELVGRLIGSVDLRIITRIVPLEGHTIDGRLLSELAIEGTLSSPLLQGRIVLTDGRYENYRLAMLMDDVEAVIVAEGRRLIVETLTATDGERGRITGEGRLEIEPERDFPFRTTLNFVAFQALRDPELSARVTGDIQLTGDARSAEASGNMTLDPFRLAIPERTAPAIARLEVREINVDPTQREATRADEPVYPVDLDLTLVFPARFFISGLGLDAEFAGNLSITGTSLEPVIRGTLAVVRGDFTLLDRRFVLTEGNIIFTGGDPPLPILDVTAEWTRQATTVRVRLTGSALEPTITLESDPPMPQDEILAEVIFGRAITDLTPLQALRLANALRILATGGNDGFDIFGTLRTTFGLEELEIREDDNGAALDIGRYLYDNVYLRLSKGLGTGRDRVSVEVELHRYVSVESEVGTNSQGGIGINYRRNY